MERTPSGLSGFETRLESARMVAASAVQALVDNALDYYIHSRRMPGYATLGPICKGYLHKLRIICEPLPASTCTLVHESPPTKLGWRHDGKSNCLCKDCRLARHAMHPHSKTVITNSNGLIDEINTQFLPSYLHYPQPLNKARDGSSPQQTEEDKVAKPRTASPNDPQLSVQAQTPHRLNPACPLFQPTTATSQQSEYLQRSPTNEVLMTTAVKQTKIPWDKTSGTILANVGLCGSQNGTLATMNCGAGLTWLSAPAIIPGAYVQPWAQSSTNDVYQIPYHQDLGGNCVYGGQGIEASGCQSFDGQDFGTQGHGQAFGTQGYGTNGFGVASPYIFDDSSAQVGDVQFPHADIDTTKLLGRGVLLRGLHPQTTMRHVFAELERMKPGKISNLHMLSFGGAVKIDFMSRIDAEKFITRADSLPGVRILGIRVIATFCKPIPHQMLLAEKSRVLMVKGPVAITNWQTLRPLFPLGFQIDTYKLHCFPYAAEADLEIRFAGIIGQSDLGKVLIEQDTRESTRGKFTVRYGSDPCEGSK